LHFSHFLASRVEKEGSRMLAWVEAVGRATIEDRVKRNALKILILNIFFIFFSFGLPLLGIIIGKPPTRIH
jgi:hypothetical protein